MIYAGLFQLDTVAWRHRKQDGSIVSGNQGAMFQRNAGTPAVEDVKTSDEKRERNKPHEDRTMPRALRRARRRRRRRRTAEVEKRCMTQERLVPFGQATRAYGR